MNTRRRVGKFIKKMKNFQKFLKKVLTLDFHYGIISSLSAETGCLAGSQKQNIDNCI